MSSTRAEEHEQVVLSVAKCLIAFQSGSLAVLASVIDSALDLLSQIVLAAASSARNVAAVEYPAGRARLEPVAVVVCAMLMGACFCAPARVEGDIQV